MWNHLDCFLEWQTTEKVCEQIQTQGDVAGSIEGDDVNVIDAFSQQSQSSVWDELIPTLIWRGSHFTFLPCLHYNLLPADWDRVVVPRITQVGNTPRKVLEIMMVELWDMLTPRWRAVVLSSLAQLDGEENENTIVDPNIIDPNVDNNNINDYGNSGGQQQSQPTPWIDAKFTIKSTEFGQAVEVMFDRFEPFQQYGFQMATEQRMSLAELSKYKYHIDLGGGGGTTWFGTIEKLAMPGVLFHHVTSSKDYYHDDLIPWVHYIPVKEDLSDLKEMYDWAEANQDDARKISEAATEYVKNRAMPHVMKATYERYFVHSLQKVLDAYQPEVGATTDNRRTKDYLSKWTLIGKCSGRYEEQCELKNWRITE